MPILGLIYCFFKGSHVDIAKVISQELKKVVLSGTEKKNRVDMLPFPALIMGLIRKVRVLVSATFRDPLGTTDDKHVERWCYPKRPIQAQQPAPPQFTDQQLLYHPMDQNVANHRADVNLYEAMYQMSLNQPLYESSHFYSQVAWPVDRQQFGDGVGTSAGANIDGEDDPIDEEVADAFVSEILACTGGQMLCQMLQHLVPVQNIIDKDTGSDSLNWDQRHFIYFLSTKRKMNLPAYIFQHLCETICEAQKFENPSKLISHPRLLSFIFEQLGLPDRFMFAGVSDDLEQVRALILDAKVLPISDAFIFDNEPPEVILEYMRLMKERGTPITHKDIGRGDGPTFAQIMKAVKEEVFSDYEEDEMVEEPSMQEASIHRSEDDHPEVEEEPVAAEPTVKDLLSAKFLKRSRTKHCTPRGQKRQRSDTNSESESSDSSFDDLMDSFAPFSSKAKHIPEEETAEPSNSSIPRTFEAGFFNFANSQLQYFGIWYKSISPRVYVWMANRDSPIQNSTPILKLTYQGTLTVVDDSRSIIWSSNASTIAAKPVLSLLDSGNLVVKDGERIMWESFDSERLVWSESRKD
ncbi:hypothetical protein TSUD_38710 [Trifolium subterraneum]|uniref:Bulb-type lectin domain-containing protein n=1 Tax=Trifolium subterraneum TaxID=3900 RepID=A0A2Z6MUT0_TRISU|nr:hypothetical protein TSUD_38710 [Trifolium subterraneum]